MFKPIESWTAPETVGRNILHERNSKTSINYHMLITVPSQVAVVRGGKAQNEGPANVNLRANWNGPLSIPLLLYSIERTNISQDARLGLDLPHRLRLDDVFGIGGSTMRILIVVTVCAVLGGCMSAGESVSFRASNPHQQALMRDGQPALVSRQKSSLVLVRPAARQLQANGRPVFVVGINNLGKQAVDFRVGQVEAVQHAADSDFEMKVVTYEMLVQEERNRQVAAALLTGLAAGANAYSAANAGHGSYTTPSGRTGTFYSPTAAANRAEQCGHSE